MPIINTAVVYNKANESGIKVDIALIESAFKAISAGLPGWSIGKVRHMDCKEPPVACDLQLHIEVPVYANIPWARINALIVNPDHYVPAAYDPYVSHFDYIICKDEATAAHFRRLCERTPTEVHVINWTTQIDVAALHSHPRAASFAETGFVSFVGGSVNKAAALEELLPHWNTYPLHIYTKRKDLADRLVAATAGAQSHPLITIHHQELADQEMDRLLRYYRGNVVVSHGEGFCHAAAKAYTAGAFLLLNVLPVYKETYEGAPGVAWIMSRADSPLSQAAEGRTLLPKIRLHDISAGLASAFSAAASAIAGSTVPVKDAELARIYTERSRAFVAGWRRLIQRMIDSGAAAGGGARHLPPRLAEESCPPISVITITYNRRKFADLCAYNLLLTDYPRDKIEWVIVEDSDDEAASGSDRFMKFAADHPEVKVVYVPVGDKMTVGAKRNLGVEQASADICLFMDDDDFYPQTSFRRRVAWLLSAAAKAQDAVAITTMAMYDLRDGRSAVNVPPWDLPLCARISEASLCFKRSFWAERKFPEDVRTSEGEEWLKGREGRVLEMPPQQILVALSHGANLSGRRIPAGTPVGCAWGWPEPLIRFLHGLIGVTVEAEGSRQKK
jgi:hypothetical protein